MSIDVVGPDKSEFSFPDGTPAETITAALAKHYGGDAAQVPPPAPSGPPPTVADQTPAAVLRGVPILGAGVNRAGAAISAAAHPLTGAGEGGGTIGERFRKNLAQEDAAQAAYEKAHPVQSAVEGMVGGGLALGGAAGAVPAVAKGLGMVGPLSRAIPAGIASGGALGGADAALRGEDPAAGAEVGAITGGMGPLGGKVAGKIWDAARGLWREAPQVPARTMRVNGVDVPVRESVLSRDPAASMQEEAARAGGLGDEAQRVARAGDTAHDAGMEQAHDNLAQSLAPGGGAPASPMAAGEAVGSEVASQEAQRAAAEAGRIQNVGNETEAIRGDLNTSPTPGVIADQPRTAAQLISEHLQRARDTVARARDRAYQLLSTTQGEFNPAGFSRISNRIRDRLNTGSDPVSITDQLTPQAAGALRDIETNVGQRRFENQTQAPLQMGPDGRPMERPITAQTIDEARKRLISMQRTANDTARRTGDFTDTRAMRRVIAEFDNHIRTLAQTPGGFSGDPQELLQRLDQARGLHSQLKAAFGPRNPQDAVGKAIEKIVGKRGVEPAEHSDVANMLFGSSSEPGGPKQAQLAQRVIDMFGENSPQHVLLKQGLLSHLADTPAGIEPMTHAKVADRISRFFNGTKGVGLAQTVFSPSERARMLAHANRMRVAEDPAAAGQVEKTIAKWSGRDTGVRASPKTIVDDLIGSTGQKGTAPALVNHLKSRLSPEALGKLKQGVWSRITESAEGTVPWKDQKIGNRIANFLNGDGKGLADALFTKAERDAMKEIADAHIANLPIEGTTNPSRSGHVIQKLARGAAHGILPFIGLHTGGLPGVAVALAANKGVSRLVDRAAANRARGMFFGSAAKPAPSRLPQIFGSLAGQDVSQGSR